MRRLLAIALSLTAFACERPRERGPERTLALAPCRLPGVSTQVLCGTHDVFEDRAAQSGPTLKLHVAVVPALAAKAAPDPLFILAGGPGQAASDVLPQLLPAFERIRRTRDLVFVDQRGTGKSAGLQCALVDPKSSLDERMNAEFDPATVTRCRETLERDHDLRHYGTSPAMDDLDDVRRALGYARINLWGASYGTRAGLVYLRQHPEAVRTAILDGVAPLSLLLPAHMAVDADCALTMLFDACARDAACNATYPNLKSRFDGLLAQLETAPVVAHVPDPTTGRAVDVRISRDSFTRLLRALLYRPEATSLVPLTIDRALAGDWRAFVGQAHMVENGMGQMLAVGMFFSVVCTEDLPFIDFDAATREAQGTFVGPGFAGELRRACALWPRGEVPAGFRAPVTSDVPVLLLSGELDPVTPPRWAEDAKRHLSNAVHVALPETGHGTYSDACVREVMERFLAAGTTQGLDARCGEIRRTPFFTSFAGPPP